MTKVGKDTATGTMQKPKGYRLIKILTIAVGVMTLVAASLTVVFWFQKSNTNTTEAKAVAATTVSENVTTAKLKKVQSSLGFSLAYDSNTFSARGQVTNPKSDGKYVYGEEFSGDELDAAREYSIVKVEPKEKATGKLSYEIPQLTVLTNIRKDYLTTRRALPENAGKSDTEIFADSVLKNYSDKDKYEIAAASTMKINNYDYRKVIVTSINKAYGVTSQSRQAFYFTVQNGRPYYANISRLDGSESQYEQIIQTISYQEPDTDKLSLLMRAKLSLLMRAKLAAVDATNTDTNNSNNTLPEGTSNVPNPLAPKTVLSVVAVNQPAVVRIGTARCADITLQAHGSAAAVSLMDSCSAVIGSGSFVSSDGYIATNGHVAYLSPQDLVLGKINLAKSYDQALATAKDVVTYAKNTGLASAVDTSGLLTALSVGETGVYDKLEKLVQSIPDEDFLLTNDTSQYAIQLSDIPLRLDKSSQRIKYDTSAKVINAVFVDKNFDSKVNGFDMSSTASDVAILKADGQFPTTDVGNMSSVGSGDRLTAIGFPAFVDEGTDTSRARTVPSVTQGYANYIVSDAGGHKLVSTSVPIAGGNSGGPTFNDDGKQIGLNTYGTRECADQKCFGNGIARDAQDLLDLASANNISFKSGGRITNDWREGIAAYEAGNFKKAVDKFTDAQAEYPANYLAGSFIDLARSQIGSAADVSEESSAFNVALLAGIVLLALTLAGVIIMIILLSRHAKKVVLPPTTTFGATGAV